MPSLTSTSYLRFRIFQVMWLLFILFHMAISSPGWTKVGNDFLNSGNTLFLILNILVVLFSLISLFHIKKTLWFWLALGCLTAVKLEALPDVPNHIMLVLIVNFTLFMGFLFHRDRSLKTESRRIAVWFKKTAPYLRIEMLLLYFFVVFHKLNYDFFNPDVSCATELYNDIAGMYFFWPQGQWINEAVILLTLLSEFLIPLLLIVPATRKAGIIFGLIFHFMLSLHPNLYILSFTAELYALFVLFIPGETISAVLRFFRGKKTQSVNQQKVLKGVAVAGVLVMVVYIILRVFPEFTLSVSTIKEDFLGFIMGIWIIWSLLLITAAIIVFYDGFLFSAQEPDSFFRLSGSPLQVLLLITVFNGITPYIGLKTATNFAMFSNLRVSGADNNHMFISSAYQISEHQNDVVTILDTNHPYFQNFIDWNERITYFELSRYLYENATEDVEVTFLRNNTGQKIHLPQHEAGGWLEYSWLSRKLLIFRGVPASGSVPCQW